MQLHGPNATKAGGKQVELSQRVKKESRKPQTAQEETKKEDPVEYLQRSWSQRERAFKCFGKNLKRLTMSLTIRRVLTIV